jgi:hypothetical protein
MFWLALAAALLLAAACGGDDAADVPDELADVCTQSDEAATDTIEVTSPDSGAQITSPLPLSATVTLEEPILYISIVAADGEHITDYPARPEAGADVSFQQSIPFGVESETPACIWVSRTNQEDPRDAIRIPVTLLPGGSL